MAVGFFKLFLPQKAEVASTVPEGTTTPSAS
jgi:hypothetical protein